MHHRTDKLVVASCKVRVRFFSRIVRQKLTRLAKLFFCLPSPPLQQPSARSIVLYLTHERRHPSTVRMFTRATYHIARFTSSHSVSVFAIDGVGHYPGDDIIAASSDPKPDASRHRLRRTPDRFRTSDATRKEAVGCGSGVDAMTPAVLLWCFIHHHRHTRASRRTRPCSRSCGSFRVLRTSKAIAG